MEGEERAPTASESERTMTSPGTRPSLSAAIVNVIVEVLLAME